MKNNLAKSQILTSAIESDTEWIPVATIDQKTFLTLDSGKVALSISKEALAGNLDTWKDGYINVNHMNDAEVKQFKIEDAKFENDMLYHKVSREAADFIRQDAAAGRSIEVHPLKIEGNKVISYDGLGLSVLFPPYKPACNAEMGCSSIPNESRNIISRFFNSLAEKAKSNSFMETMTEESGTGSSTDFNSEANDMEADSILKLTSALAEAKSDQEDAKKEIITLKSSLAESETTVETQKGEMKEMTEKLKVHDDAKEVADKKLQDDRWEKIKAKIPKGKLGTPEAEAALKKEFVEDPSGFNLKMIDFMSDREDPKGESGSTHASGSNADDSEKAAFKILDSMED